MTATIITFIVVEVALIGLWVYMKPRGGIRALFMRGK
jgi:hypothetical protein